METAIQSRFRRTIRLLLYLQSGPRFNAAQLAKEFQVSRRTIFRDMNFLRDMGLPVRFDEEQGGFSLEGEVAIAKDARVTRDEWFVLLLAAHLSLAAAVPDVASAVRQATAKLLGTLVADDRQKLCQVLNACSVDLPPAKPNEHVNTIITAIRNQEQIRLGLGNVEHWGTSTTKVSPYRLVAASDHWLLVGRSSFHRKTCSFDVGDIQSVEMTGESYTVPRGFRNPAWISPEAVPTEIGR
jgi:predicted DNA-binding transcriptional regulator YafY